LVVGGARPPPTSATPAGENRLLAARDMKLEVHLYLHGDAEETSKRFDRIDRFLTTLIAEGKTMTQLVDDLVAAVGEIAVAVDALEAVVTDLKSKIADPADVAKLEGALAGLKAAVADAGDGVDEAVPPAP
jgi:ABC-type transporter Mla subunit MlaD